MRIAWWITKATNTCRPLVPELAGSNRPNPSDFFGRKNPQHDFLRKGTKAVCPMSQICGMVKNPVITWKLGHRQNLSAISRPISSLANRGFWRLRGVERLWSWQKELSGAQRACSLRLRCIGITRTANQSTYNLQGYKQTHTHTQPECVIQ
jgi:hypothetical protein